MTGSSRPASQQGFLCCICTSPISLDLCNTDERGNLVHEQCYVRETISRFRTRRALLQEFPRFDGCAVPPQVRLAND